MNLFPDLPAATLIEFRKRCYHDPKRLRFGPDVLEAAAAHMQKVHAYTVKTDDTLSTFQGVPVAGMACDGVAVEF